MIVCKFTKLHAARYMPHLDVMRTLTMALRRTGLSIAYSDGFNPHPLIYFAPPTPVGTASECEYFAAATPEPPEAFLKKLNTSLPHGIQILQSAFAAANPNLAAACGAAQYEIAFEKPVALPLKEMLSAKEFEISYLQNGVPITKQVRELILDAFGSGKTYRLTLACGNKNLRADRLIAFLLRNNPAPPYFTVTKKRLFTANLTDFDTLFFNDSPKKETHEKK
ncbi:MAG: TIGR03936 family radical SAM-associated protein [Firmicutes bacterium]|nr:TIGR03936 family radical SAM-associated protein [Bacillota bacterium]